MMPSSTRVAAIAAVVGVTTWTSPASPDEGALAGRAESVIRPWVDAGAYQGVVLLARGDRIVFHRAYGRASIELDVPNVPDTRFQIASVSKPFTATAVLLLAERGRLDLDASLDELLPGFPHADRLTVDHLLTHTSGLPNINGFDGYEGWSKDHWASAEPLVEIIAEHVEELPFEPGSRYAYSNSNYNLLAHLVEKVSGKPFGEFLEAQIFEPCGMSSTAHRGDPTAVVPGLANGYAARGARDFERSEYLDWTIKIGNGSLYSTAADLFRFDRCLRAGSLLARDTLERAYGFDRTYGSGDAERTGLGQGWFPGSAHGHRRVRMTGRSPGYTANFQRFPDDDACLVVLANVYLGPPPDMVDGLVAALLDLPDSTDFGSGAEVAGEALQGRQLDRFTGRYRFGDDWYVGRTLVRVENRRDHLAVVYLDGTNAGYEFLLVSLGGNRFFDRTHGGTVRFDGGPEERPDLVYSFGGEKVARPVP